MKIILVTAQKGGVGKSTISFLIANKYATDNKKVAIVDLDNQGSFIKHKTFLEEDNLFKIYLWNEVEENPDFLDDFDYVIIDSPPYNMNKLAEFVSLSNAIVVPIKLEELALSSVTSTFERLKTLGASDKTIVVPTDLSHLTNYKEGFSFLDSHKLKRVEHALMHYSDISRLFLSNVSLTGNAKIKTDLCINDITNFVNKQS